MKELKLLFEGQANIKNMNIWLAIFVTLFFIKYPEIVLGLSDGLFKSTDVIMYNDLKPLFNILVLIITSVSTVVIVAKLFVEIDDDSKEHTQEDKIFDSVAKKRLINIFLIMIGYILIRNAILLPIFDIFENQFENEGLNPSINKFTFDQILLYIGIYIYQSLAIAPVTEEILFRGIILKGIMHKYSIKKSIIISSILFAIIHGSLQQGLYAFISGIIFSLIYIYTGSIKFSIMAHFINNICMVVPTPNNIILNVLYVTFGVLFITSGIKMIKKEYLEGDKNKQLD